jgi:hypothetical protein
MPQDRITYSNPTWRSHAFSTTAIIEDQTATTLEPGDVLDLGTSAGGSPGNFAGLTLKFEDTFDDSVYDTLRLWVMNWQNLTGHSIKGDFDDQLAWGVAQTNDVGTPVELAKDPYSTNATFTNATVANVYDNTAGNKQIETIALHSDPGASATAWDYANEYLANPALVLEIPRVDASSTKLRPTYSGLDLADGQLFTFSEVELYEVLTSGSTEFWQRRAAIKDQSFDINTGEDVINWDKYKPSATVHQAISTVMGEVKFQVDNIDPDFMARAFDETATENTTDETIDFALTAKTRAVNYKKYVIQWFTQGGFLVRMIMPKCKLTATGSFAPGGDDFAGVEFTLKALINNTTAKSLCTTKWSRVPMEQAILPFTYAVT